jgi:hypothetical protein
MIIQDIKKDIEEVHMQKIATTKIIGIREGVPQEMYDIGVKDWHNFTLGNNMLVGNCVHTIAF